MTTRRNRALRGHRRNVGRVVAWSCIGLVAFAPILDGGAQVPARAASPPVPPICRPAAAPLVFTSTAPVAIPDSGTATSQVAVTGFDPDARAFDIDVRTNIRHPMPGELEIELVPPDPFPGSPGTGPRITLSSANGGTAADAFNGTLWDDEADPDGQVPSESNPNLATDQPYSPGVVATPLAPEQALATLAFGPPSGVWSLVVTDNISGAGGSLDSWQLMFTPRPADSFGGTPRFIDQVSATPVPIGAGDPGTITSTLVVPPAPGLNYLEFSPQVETNITHGRSDDLDITLRSPAGTVVTLTTDNGDGAADVFAGTAWGDRSENATLLTSRVTDLTFLGGAVSPLIPEEPLAAFRGENPVGMWTLTVSDDTPGVGGTLNSWRLRATGGGCTPDLPITVTPSTARARAGVPLTLDISTTVGPELGGSDVVLTARIPPTMRFGRLTPSPGGACTAPGVGKSNAPVTCTWVGDSHVGTMRSMRVLVTPFVSGSSTIPVEAKNGIRGRRSPPQILNATISVAKSARRSGNGRPCTIVGTNDADVLTTEIVRAGAVVCGLGGNDRISGAGFADVLDGGPGNDVISGKGRNDVIFGGLGRDNISGGAGNDILTGGPGPDALRGGPGRDTAIDPLGDTRLSIEVARVARGGSISP